MTYAKVSMDCDRCESHTQPMPSSLGLEQRIRELCARALMASDSECIQLLGELRNLIREQSEALRKLASKKLGNPNGHSSHNGQPRNEMDEATDENR